MKTFRQVLKEFWIQVVISCVWALYNVQNLSSDKNLCLEFVKQFGVSFFLASWFLGQIIRIKKQHKIEGSFVSIELRLASLIKKLEVTTEEIINYLTGGDSYGVVDVLTILENGRDVHLFYFNNKGNYTLYDVNISYSNPEQIKMENREDERATVEHLKHYTRINIGNIPSPGGNTFGNTFQINEGEKLKLNFHINARNGAFSQLLRIIRANGKLIIARKINTITSESKGPSKILLEEINMDFPKNENGKIDWD